MTYQVLCDQCNITEDEDKLIETFDNQLLCSSCYIKKEFKTESNENENNL